MRSNEEWLAAYYKLPDEIKEYIYNYAKSALPEQRYDVLSWAVCAYEATRDFYEKQQVL